jgi:hypothetical protein
VASTTKEEVMSDRTQQNEPIEREQLRDLDVPVEKAEGIQGGRDRIATAADRLAKACMTTKHFDEIAF